MTARRVLPAVAAFAILTASTARAQDPPAPAEQPPAAQSRAGRARSERADDQPRNVRSPRRAEAAGSDSQEAQPRVRAVVPDSTAANAGATANAEEQGGARRRPSGGGSGGGGAVGGGGSVSSGRSGRGGSGDTGAIRTRPGGVRNPGVDGGEVRSQAIPRSQAPRPSHPIYAAPHYGRRYYYGPTGLGYYFYDPWSWYGYGGWGGYYGSPWSAYYGVGPGYYGSVYSGGYYSGGYGGVYAGPVGWSIGSVRLKVEPKDAEVYVDGYYAGIVDDFDGMWQQLRLDDGGHRIEVRKPGLTTLTFDVMVQPGRTITYRGDLRVIP